MSAKKKAKKLPVRYQVVYESDATRKTEPSTNYPGKFKTRAEAEQLLNGLDEWFRESMGYRVQEVRA
jgi:hypothetical protein